VPTANRTRLTGLFLLNKNYNILLILYYWETSSEVRVYSFWALLESLEGVLDQRLTLYLHRMVLGAEVTP